MYETVTCDSPKGVCKLHSLTQECQYPTMLGSGVLCLSEERTSAMAFCCSRTLSTIFCLESYLVFDSVTSLCVGKMEMFL